MLAAMEIAVRAMAIPDRLVTNLGHRALDPRFQHNLILAPPRECILLGSTIRPDLPNDWYAGTVVMA
jgi:hypothetical protein